MRETVLHLVSAMVSRRSSNLVLYHTVRSADRKTDSPTLTFNTIGRHISKMVYTKVVSNKSPWLQKAQLGGVYCNPASHGEGRFVANDEWLAKLFANGQVATQYVDSGRRIERR